MFITAERPGVRKELPFPLSEVKCLFLKPILRSQIKHLQEEIRNSDGTWFAFPTASGSSHVYPYYKPECQTADDPRRT